MRRRLVALLGLAVSAATFPATSQAISFTGLGFQSGADSSLASGASGDGSVVVGVSGVEAFRWTAGGGLVGLGVAPGQTFSQGLAVSADGSVVVGSSGAQAFRWTSGGGMVDLGVLPSRIQQRERRLRRRLRRGGRQRCPSLSLDVGRRDGRSRRCPRGVSSMARGISADGSVVVGDSTGASGQQAFRWTASGGMVGLGVSPGGTFSAERAGVSADGSVVVGAADGLDGGAFRWTAGAGIVDLGILEGGEFSIAKSVSANGSVVVGVADSALFPFPVGEAFVWDTVHGMRSVWQLLTDAGVDVTGWTFDGGATGVSADGLAIVGYGTNPLGLTEAWVVYLPEPGAPLLLLTALLAWRLRAIPRA